MLALGDDKLNVRDDELASSEVAGFEGLGKSRGVDGLGKKKHGHEGLPIPLTPMGWRLKNVGGADTMPTSHSSGNTKSTHYHAHYQHFLWRGVSKLTIN